jgi:hypothetical protein
VAGVVLLRTEKTPLHARRITARAEHDERCVAREHVVVPKLPVDRRTKGNVMLEQQIFSSIGSVQGNVQIRASLNSRAVTGENEFQVPRGAAD